MQSEESERERERERGGVWRSVTYKWTAGCSCVNRQNRGMTEYKYTDSRHATTVCGIQRTQT